MKIHISELRGARYSLIYNCSLEFVDFDLEKLEKIDNGENRFAFYFTKTGKKTVRALETTNYSEFYKFACFYSKREEIFEVNEELWKEVEVNEKGFIKSS